MNWPRTFVPFDTALDDQTPGQTKIQRNEYAAQGLLPVVDQGQKLIGGYCDDETRKYTGPLPVIVFGDHTRAFKFVDFPFALGADGVRVLTATPAFDARFLFYYLVAAKIPSRGYARHFKFLREVKFPFVARSEQRRIVDLLEQADALRRQRADADAIADRILPAVFHKMFGDPVTNPKGWPVQPLGKLVEFVSGATPSKERADYWDGTVPWVSAKDMKRLEITDTIDHISETALRETNIKLITPGAVLIVVRGMILAHTVPIALNRAPLTINQDMKALVPANDVPAEFLQWVLLSQHQNLLRLVSTAAHGTRKLDTDALTALKIPVPAALLEQFARYTREQSLARECRRSAAEKIETLFAVILHRAFTGELTARWREAHMKELLAEMEQQARHLPTNGVTP